MTDRRDGTGHGVRASTGLAVTVISATAAWAGSVAGLPSPPLSRPGRLLGWWASVGPALGLFGLLRTALFGLAVSSAVAGAVVVALRIVVALVRTGWRGVGGPTGLLRLALGLSASGGALAACTPSRPVVVSAPAASVPPNRPPPAPVLIGPEPSSPGERRSPLSIGRPAAGHPTPTPAPIRAPTPAGTPIPSPAPILAPGTGPPHDLPHPHAAEPATPAAANPATPAAVNPATPAAVPGPSPTNPLASARPTWTVRSGDNFWSIAEALLTRDGHRPSDPEVALYWRRLIAANLASLPEKGDPDLLFTGQLLVLPPLAEGPG